MRTDADDDEGGDEAILRTGSGRSGYLAAHGLALKNNDTRPFNNIAAFAHQPIVYVDDTDKDNWFRLDVAVASRRAR